MKQKLFIFLAFVFLVIVLIGLNAASYVQKEKMPDSELNPNRSTYNSGATGTRAFYDLLAETGRRPVRWQEPPSALLGDAENRPRTFVVTGAIRREFEEKEITQLLRWVSEGGKLVIIDREPPKELIKPAANWKVFADPETQPAFLNIDPSDVKQMTEKTAAAKPVQPTVYTSNLNAVQPSRFAATITMDFSATEGEIEERRIESSEYNSEENYASDDEENSPAINKPAASSSKKVLESDVPKSVETIATSAPVAHLANNEKTLLIDFAYGAGEIVFLSDPFIVSNGGISLVDNAQLAINLVSSDGGQVAFDEFHQGYGAGENRLLGYFAGTPLTAILLQFAAFVGFVLFTQSRRFARPLPETEPNRLSKLEYVSAMAELQQRTRAYDLAIENIYTDFRRRVSRLVGADNFTVSLKDLARMIAERAKLNASEVESLMFKCEDIIRGEPTGKREVLELISHLRDIEEKLGLKRQKGMRK